tara:strand:+ start:6552 stop:7091 length:540 start_codon:yes stop_codon:yes gene_type:complete
MAVINNFMSLATFLTANEVIQKVFTNQNTDPSLISTEIRQIAEVAHIIEPLGRDFYIHLKEAFDGSTQTPDETILMDNWIQPCLAQFTKFEVILEIQNQSTSSGIVGNIPEFASLVSPSDLNVYKQDVFRKGKILKEQMLDFLNDNSNSYPEYQSESGSGILCSENKSGTVKTHGMIIY